MNIVYAVGIEYEGVVELFSSYEKAQAFIAEAIPALQDVCYIENMEVK